MSEENKSGDSSELEALFDSVAREALKASAPQTVAQPIPRSIGSAIDSGDSQSLQALFDSVANKTVLSNKQTLETVPNSSVQDKVFKQVGQMARQLHDTLGALGYDKLIESTVSAIPDANDRLTYIANLTEKAACKVLNATDVANPLQDELENGAALLSQKWEAVYANKIGADEFKLLAAETHAFLKNAVPQRTIATKAQLMEIMMAQDFQDLTGQVIKKVISLSQELEAQLMALLIDTMPGEKRTESVASLLNGPVVNAEGRTDIVVGQQQVDDLLDSLGF